MSRQYILVHDKGIRAEIEQRCVLNIHTYTHKCIHKNEEILMTITVLISITGSVVVADIYNYLLLLPICISFALKQALQLGMVIYLAGCPKPPFLRSLGH